MEGIEQKPSSAVFEAYLDMLALQSPINLVFARLNSDFEEEIKDFRAQLAEENVYVEDEILWCLSTATLLYTLGKHKDAVNVAMSSKEIVAPNPNHGHLYNILRQFVAALDPIESMYQKALKNSSEDIEDNEISLGLFMLAYIKKLHEMLSTERGTNG